MDLHCRVRTILYCVHWSQDGSRDQVQGAQGTTGRAQGAQGGNRRLQKEERARDQGRVCLVASIAFMYAPCSLVCNQCNRIVAQIEMRAALWPSSGRRRDVLIAVCPNMTIILITLNVFEEYLRVFPQLYRLRRADGVRPKSGRTRSCIRYTRDATQTENAQINQHSGHFRPISKKDYIYVQETNSTEHTHITSQKQTHQRAKANSDT